MNKKILYLSPQNVIPANDGGKIGIYYPIKELAKKNKLFFAYIGKNNRKDYEKLQINSINFEKNVTDNPIILIRNLFSKIPFKMEKYFDKRFFKILLNLVEREKIDVVISSHSHMAMYALKIKDNFPNIKIILREHNIEYELVKEYYQFQKNILLKTIAFWQYRKTKIYEISLWEKFDSVIFISDNDKKEALKYLEFNDKKYKVIYDGYNIKKTSKNIKKEKNSFIFTGSLRTIQNQVNLKKFIDEIWIKFISDNKNYKLYITGNSDEVLSKQLNRSIQELNQLNIINLGFVNNIDEVIMSKEYFISPTYIGSGIRIKILHALSLGMIVFASEKDCNMVKYFKDMENILCFKDYNSFKDKLYALTHKQKEMISENARMLVFNELNWSNYIKKMREIL